MLKIVNVVDVEKFLLLSVLQQDKELIYFPFSLVTGSGPSSRRGSLLFDDSRRPSLLNFNDEVRIIPAMKNFDYFLLLHIFEFRYSQ